MVVMLGVDNKLTSPLAASALMISEARSSVHRGAARDQWRIPRLTGAEGCPVIASP